MLSCRAIQRKTWTLRGMLQLHHFLSFDTPFSGPIEKYCFMNHIWREYDNLLQLYKDSGIFPWPVRGHFTISLPSTSCASLNMFWSSFQSLALWSSNILLNFMFQCPSLQAVVTSAPGLTVNFKMELKGTFRGHSSSHVLCQNLVCLPLLSSNLNYPASLIKDKLLTCQTKELYDFSNLLYISYDACLLDELYIWDNKWILFAGVKSKLDIGVMEGPNREPHFFVNVADIHL